MQVRDKFLETLPPTGRTVTSIVVENLIKNFLKGFQILIVFNIFDRIEEDFHVYVNSMANRNRKKIVIFQNNETFKLSSERSINSFRSVASKILLSHCFSSQRKGSCGNGACRN